MNADDLYVRRLRRLKWAILGAAALCLAALETYHYFFQGMPLVEVFAVWLIGIAVAAVLLEIIFRAVARLESRVQQESTERKKTEKALRESEERWRHLIESATDVVFETDPDGHFTFINSAAARATGYALEELIGMLYLDLVRPDAHEATRMSMLREREERIPVAYYEFPGVRKDGTVVWIGQNVRLITEGQQVKGFQAIARDITKRKQAEEALFQAKEQWERTFDAVPDLIAIIDDQHRFVRVNKAMADRLGLRPEECVGRTCYACVHGKEEPPDFCPHAKLLADGQEHTVEVWEERLGGNFIVTASPLFDASGKLTGSVHVARDITERRRTEKAVEESERRYREALQVAGAAPYYHTYTEDYTIDKYELVGDEIKTLTGFAPEEFTPQSFTSITEEVQLLGDLKGLPLGEAARKARSGKGVSWRADYRIRTRSGEERWLANAAIQVRNDHGKIVGSLGILQDITERKGAEEALRESEAKFRALTETSPAGTFIHRGAKLCYVNPKVEEVFGYPQEELLEKEFWEIVHPDFRGLVRDRGQARLRGDPIPSRYEFKVLTKDGQEKWIDIAALPIDFEGQPAILGTALDITERKQAEEAVEKSERRYREALQVAGAAPYYHTYSEDYTIDKYMFVGDEIRMLTGYSPAEFTHEVWVSLTQEIQLLDELEELTLDQAVEKARSGKGVSWRADYRIRTRSGEEKWLANAAIQVHDEQGKVVGSLGILQDITERKRAESSLREREALLRATLESTADGILVVNEKGQVTHSNSRMVEMWRVPEELFETGDDAQELLTYAAAQLVDPESFLTKVDTLYRSSDEDFDTLVFKDGRVFERQSCPLIQNEKITGRVWSFRDVTERKRAEGELNQYRHHLEELVNARTAELVAANESLQHEIAERRRAEEMAQQHQQQLAHASRLSTMGEVASGLAHELNQPLAAISNYAWACIQRTRSGTLQSDKLPATMEKIAEQAERAGEIIRRIRSFVHKSEPHDRSTADLNALVRDAASLAKHGNRRGHPPIELKLAESLPPVPVDRIEIEQVVVNLVRNGIEAMEDTESSNARLVITTSRNADNEVEVAVSDRGSGFPPEVTDQLFNPFFSTKPNGIGMGLSISRTIIEAHGGRLWATRNPDQGATFTFTLPVSGGTGSDGNDQR